MNRFRGWAALGLALIAGFMLVQEAVNVGLGVESLLLLPLLGATIDFQSVQNALKIVYEEPMHNQIVTHSRVLDLFKAIAAVKQGPDGKYIELSNMFGAPEGGGWRSDNGNLPVPGNPTFVSGRVSLKTYMHVVQMSRHAQRSLQRGKSAFVNWADITLKPAAKVIAAEEDRVAIGYGSGILCRVDGAPSTTMPIDAPYGLPGNVKGWLPGIRRGMRIVFAPNPDGSGMRPGSALVLSVNRAGNSGGGTLSLDTVPPGTLDNDYIFRGDDYGNNAPEAGVPVEAMGLMGHIDDGTLVPTHQNIDRNVFDEWKAQYVNAATGFAGVPTEQFFMALHDRAFEDGGGEVTHILSTLGQFRQAFEQLRTTSGFGATHDQSKGDLTAAVKGIKVWMGDKKVELRPYPKMPLGRVYVLDASTLQRYHAKSGAFEWVDWTGSMFHQVSSGGAVKDAVWFYGRCELEFGCTSPQKNAFADGLTEPTV